MSTVPGAPHVKTKLHSTVNAAAVVLGMLVAVGVAVLFVALTGAHRTNPAPRQQSPRYAPMQYHGAGTRPTAADIETTPGH